MTSWRRYVSDSVPSRLSYSPSPNFCQQWGYDIDDDSHVCKNIRDNLERRIKPNNKDELERFARLIWEAANLNFDQKIPEHLTKTPEQIAADFLYRVAEKTNDEVASTIGCSVAEEADTDLVVTYPQKWPESLKQQYYHILKLAFNTSLFPKLRDIYFVTESEAHALTGLISATESGHFRLFRPVRTDTFLDHKLPSPLTVHFCPGRCVHCSQHLGYVCGRYLIPPFPCRSMILPGKATIDDIIYRPVVHSEFKRLSGRMGTSSLPDTDTRPVSSPRKVGVQCRLTVVKRSPPDSSGSITPSRT